MHNCRKLIDLTAVVTYNVNINFKINLEGVMMATKLLMTVHCYV